MKTIMNITSMMILISFFFLSQSNSLMAQSRIKAKASKTQIIKRNYNAFNNNRGISQGTSYTIRDSFQFNQFKVLVNTYQPANSPNSQTMHKRPACTHWGPIKPPGPCVKCIISTDKANGRGASVFTRQ